MPGRHELLSRDVIYLPKDCFASSKRHESRHRWNIRYCSIHELGLDVEGRVFYTMKYVRGLTLTEILLALEKAGRRLWNDSVEPPPEHFPESL